MIESPWRSKAALAMLSVSTFAYVTIEMLPIGLLTVMADDLGRSRSEIGLLVTGYAVVVVLASIPLTLLTHKVPRRRVIGGTLAIFTAASVFTAFAPTYGALLAGRLLTALSQALFWSVVVPVAAGLVPPEVRGRAVGRLTIGAALAPVVGIPAGTWLGERAGWQIPFAVLAGVGLVTCLGIMAILPRVEAQYGATDRGTEPDVRRYVVLVMTCAIGVTGFLTANTYITPFLLEVSGFGVGALGPILLVSGLGGLTGVLLIGLILDRRPWTAVVLPLVLITCALLGLYALGGLQISGCAVRRPGRDGLQRARCLPAEPDPASCPRQHRPRLSRHQHRVQPGHRNWSFDRRRPDRRPRRTQRRPRRRPAHCHRTGLDARRTQAGTESTDDPRGTAVPTPGGNSWVSGPRWKWLLPA
jgi:predicted MFS family arabinose efflux permease